MTLSGFVMARAHDVGSGPEAPARTTASAPSATTAPPPATTTTVLEITTTTLPPETTTTTVPETTTTTAAPAPVTTTTAPPPRTVSAVVPPPDRQAMVEALADSTGWDWRAAGVRFTIGYHPDACCHWGIYDSRQGIVFVGPTAFATEARLRYVVLHELAHAWQYRTGRFTELIADYRPFGVTGTANALEAGADCIALVWRAGSDHYWNCPAAAVALAARRLAGDWS